MGDFLPFIIFLVALSFFGIDQVGAELEGPYGIDDNDLPLLHMGVSLVDDLDIILRANEHSLQMEARRMHEEAAAHGANGGAQGAAAAHTQPRTSPPSCPKPPQGHEPQTWPQKHSKGPSAMRTVGVVVARTAAMNARTVNNPKGPSV